MFGHLNHLALSHQVPVVEVRVPLFGQQPYSGEGHSKSFTLKLKLDMSSSNMRLMKPLLWPMPAHTLAIHAASFPGLHQMPAQIVFCTVQGQSCYPALPKSTQRAGPCKDENTRALTLPMVRPKPT